MMTDFGSDFDQYFLLASRAKKSNSSPISLTLSLTPHSSELRTHSQTQPYLRHEPTQSITDQAKKQQFLDNLFPVDDVSVGQTFDFSDLRYDPEQPRRAESTVSDRLNKVISSSSQNVFFSWPKHTALPGFMRDRPLDLATILRRHPAVTDPPPTDPVCPDVTDVQSCVEHTVTSGSGGRNHNKQHAYAKANELLKCPLNMSIVALGIHGSGMTVWYADRCGVIEVDLGTDRSLHRQVVCGLSKGSPFRDPCVSVYCLEPRRVLEFRIRSNVYYGLYGLQGEPLYVADGIACRGTLVLPGRRTTSGKAQDSEIVAIKLSYPSLPWAASFPQANDTASDWIFEWQVLQSLRKFGVRNVPEVVDHIEHAVSTKAIREAAGLEGKRHRTRTILITQPLAQSTLQATESVIELRVLVQVMKDVIDAHEDAWRKAAIAHCDISLGNIQIHHGRGILGDWEFGTPVAKLSTARAVNSGTLDTMPPRLAYHKLKPSSSLLSGLCRTLWDEVCSMFLCFISPLVIKEEIRVVDSAGLAFKLLDRMDRLCDVDPVHILQPQYQSNLTVVKAMRRAAPIIFPNKWRSPPHNANSLHWWDTLRVVVDSFVLTGECQSTLPSLPTHLASTTSSTSQRWYNPAHSEDGQESLSGDGTIGSP